MRWNWKATVLSGNASLTVMAFSSLGAVHDNHYHHMHVCLRFCMVYSGPESKQINFLPALDAVAARFEQTR